MENIIIVVILAAIVGGILWYLWREKKRGRKCIGCPYSKECASKKRNHGNSCKDKNDGSCKSKAECSCKDEDLE
jgi:FtsZ-interacting cell division protein ZipA